MDNAGEIAGGFVAGTLVHTQNGLVPIDKIHAGDWVLSKLESGKSEVSYKRVVNTFGFEEKAVWYVSYTLMEKPQEGEDVGGCFVIVTGNHPFWVVDMEWWAISEHEPVHRNTWVRADQLRSGMFLLLCDGRPATVSHARKIIRTATPDIGWMPITSDHNVGSIVDFRGEQPTGYPRHGRGHIGDALVPNEGVDWYGYEDHVWLRRKVYNLDVENHHTYFVDRSGVWVYGSR